MLIFFYHRKVQFGLSGSLKDGVRVRGDEQMPCRRTTLLGQIP
ncbi:hypothetical protein C404_28820 [Ralstonia sp. AU12-08]|nr:hypothetical protein C404_28820 [Ralstonia sp. AU12-08]